MSDDDYTTAEIVRSLHRIEATQQSMNQRLDTMTSLYITRVEHQKDIDRIDEDVSELKGARAPWWAATSVLIGAGGLLIALITLYVSR